MGYTMHEMNVILFSTEDGVFTTEITISPGYDSTKEDSFDKTSGGVADVFSWSDDDD